METMNSQPVQSQPTRSPLQYHHSSRKWVITGSIVVVVLAIILGIAYYVRDRQEYFASPEGKLERLRESSEPVAVTPEEMEKNLETPNAKPADSTQEERLQELRALENL